jgi:hypothetical protein
MAWNMHRKMMITRGAVGLIRLSKRERECVSRK